YPSLFRSGIERVRTTLMKELLFLDVREEDIEPLSKALEETGLYPKPSEFRRGVMSCTGLEFCKLAHTTTKSRAIELVDDLEEVIGDLDVPISITLNGCPNSCARTHVADIDLKSQTLTNDDGNRIEGFQDDLGGAMGPDPECRRNLRGHKDKGTEVTEYVTRVLTNFKNQRHPGEQVRDWALRAEDE